MKHSFIDTYANLNSPLHRLEPKVKLIFILVSLLSIVFTPIRYAVFYLIYGIFVLILVSLSRIPLKFIFKRILEIIPFVIIFAISLLFKKEGVMPFLSCIIKAILAIILLLVVSATTKFEAIIKALKDLKVPGLFIQLLSFMYRYSFLLEDEFLRTKRACESRNVDCQSKIMHVRILSNIVGAIFVHAYERAERLYLAMCARGYEYEKNH